MCPNGHAEPAPGLVSLARRDVVRRSAENGSRWAGLVWLSRGLGIEFRVAEFR